MNKTILVVGANSAVAQEVMPLLAKNNTLITAGRKDCEVIMDITQPVTIPKNVDVVINFAASFGGENDQAIMAAVQTNAMGTLNLCEAAHAANVGHIVIISSVFTLLDETSPSYSIYALSKKQGDELAAFYCRQYNIPLTILQPSRMYGDSGSFAKHQPFLYQLIDKAQRGEDISLYGTHDASRNYLHSHDFAEITSRIIERQAEGAFVCTFPTNNTYSYIARSAQQVFSQGGIVSFLKGGPDISDDTFPLDQSLYDLIDFTPNISIEAGIERIKQHRERERA